MTPLISILVPVYNSEEYLVECLTSILNQSIRDIEVIIVDDGSIDQSLEICKKMEENDKRIIVISQDNRGPSVARNVGLRIAKGQYIGFVDSDDWIDRDMYEILLSNLIEYETDIAICGYYTVYGINDIRYRHCGTRKVLMNSIEMLQEYIDWNLIGAAVWSKLYKRELFENVRFPEDLKGREDAFVMPRLLGTAKKGIHIGSPKYHYRIRVNSIYRKKFDLSKLSWLRVEKNLVEYLQESYPSLVNSVTFLYPYAIIDLLKDINESNVLEKYNDVYWSLLKRLNDELDLLKAQNKDKEKIIDISNWIQKLSGV
jgi:glycosyltransferase involved in cell wall biosynthesis